MSDVGLVATSFDAGPSGGDSGAASGGASIPNFMDVVPQDLRSEPWIQDISKNEKPFDALFQWGKNANQLIGKKSTGLELPGENATPEQIKNFHKALGVPDSPDGYEYKAPDISKEAPEVQKYLSQASQDQGFLKTMKAACHELGITPKQFNALAQKFDAWSIENAKSTVESLQKAGQRSAEEQREKFTKYYGDKADTVHSIAKDLAQKIIPKEVHDLGDPDIALIEVLRFMHEKFYANDKIGTSSGQAAQLTQEDMHSNILKFRKDNEAVLRNPFAREYEEVNNKLRGMYEEMRTLPKKGKE
jgi:hypothetical protein